MRSVGRLPALAAALLACLAADRRASAGAEGVPPPEARFDQALRLLSSPFEADRAEGVAALSSLDEAARSRVVREFLSAPAGRRQAFVEVLAADGSDAALDALLAALEAAADPGESAAIRRALAENSDRVADRVAARRAPDGSRPAYLEDLARVLERARVESVFLSRKSRSGATGTYRDQFAPLRPWRKHAIELMFAILEDREPKTPGVYPAGRFRFLTAPRFVASDWEIRDMAANALSDLVEPGDDGAFRAVYRNFLRFDLESRERDPFGAKSRPAAALADTLVAILYVHRSRLPKGTGPEDMPTDPVRHFDRLVDGRIRERADTEITEEDAAILCLRLRRYAEAIRRYETVLDQGLSRAYPHYNLACAHSLWSSESGLSDAERAGLRAKALGHLSESIAAGYLDWPWMEQDRDLDAIRDAPAYRTLLAKVKAEFRAPAGSEPAPRAPR
jgi:hypothetical protein